VRCPRVRDRAGEGSERIRFSSAILPPYARRSKSLKVLIPSRRCAVTLQFGLCLHGRHERLDAHNVHDAREIVSEHVQCHLAGHAWQRLHQEVGDSHPGLDLAEGMLAAQLQKLKVST
jgi:hypothetical protein